MGTILGSNKVATSVGIYKKFVPLFTHVRMAGGPQGGLHLGVKLMPSSRLRRGHSTDIGIYHSGPNRYANNVGFFFC